MQVELILGLNLLLTLEVDSEGDQILDEDLADIENFLIPKWEKAETKSQGKIKKYEKKLDSLKAVSKVCFVLTMTLLNLKGYIQLFFLRS